MSSPATDPALAACAAFILPAPVTRLTRHGSGHIHQTYRAHTAAGDFLLQRLNTVVFPDPDAIAVNAARIAAHLAAGGGTRLTPRPTQDGSLLHRDCHGAVWRVFDFLDNTLSFDVAPDLATIETAAQAFGDFQRRLADLPAPPLLETLPGFHDTRRRFAQLEQAASDNRAGRREGCAAELAELLQRRPLASALQDRHLPVRTVHNDTKLNNLLFDAASGAPLCVIDWDTTMPGLAAHDFGDMVRTMAGNGAEDEPDSTQVRIVAERLAAIRRGYLAAVADWLSPEEIASLDLGARTLIFEQACRFLADHLEGDVYYPVHRPDHNLARARVQLALLASFENVA
jgi:aminoglycoside phosphotransferase (APT) family kinase protein